MLIVRQFADHGPEQRRIVDGGGPNVKHGQVRTPRELMQNRRGVGADADPGSVFQKPGVDEALVPSVGLAGFDALHPHHSSRDRDISKYVHIE